MTRALDCSSRRDQQGGKKSTMSEEKKSYGTSARIYNMVRALPLSLAIDRRALPKKRREEAALPMRGASPFRCDVTLDRSRARTEKKEY